MILLLMLTIEKHKVLHIITNLLINLPIYYNIRVKREEKIKRKQRKNKEKTKI